MNIIFLDILTMKKKNCDFVLVKIEVVFSSTVLYYICPLCSIFILTICASIIIWICTHSFNPNTLQAAFLLSKLFSTIFTVVAAFLTLFLQNINDFQNVRNICCVVSIICIGSARVHLPMWINAKQHSR